MNKCLKITAAASLAVFAGSVFAGSPNAPYENSSVDARLNVTIKPETDVVHFIRDDAGPNVITKTYVLKHADPYELRAYLRKIVQTRKISTKLTNVKAVKYTDGTSVLMISAEDYRFDDTAGTQGFDSIIKELDRPKITSSSGRPVYVYSPKYNSAASLLSMVKNVGANLNDELMGTIGATDALACDEGLNLMLFKTAPFSCKAISDVLAEYDRPAPEVRAKVTVYEIYAENDTKLGLDFQSWKNNEGIDLFNGGARFMQNYAPDGSGLLRDGDWSATKYFNFNPKWNTKYVDFLTSKGKAKVMHTSEMVLTNNKTGGIDRTTQVFVVSAEPIEDNKVIEDYARVAVAPGEYIGLSFHGEVITAAGAGTMTVLKQQKNESAQYTLRLEGTTFNFNGVGGGVKAIAKSINSDIRLSSNDYANGRGNTINTAAVNNGFGFSMEMTPSISSEATVLNVKINNSSLIGYQASGQPRIQKNAEINTNFMISNSGTKLVIGGIEKRDVVSISGGVPILKDLPVIGWIFSTESESTKKSQLLVVAEVIPVKAGETYTAAEKKALQELDEKLNKAGESNTFGYRQFFIDADRVK